MTNSTDAYDGIDASTGDPVELLADAGPDALTDADRRALRDHFDGEFSDETIDIVLDPTESSLPLEYGLELVVRPAQPDRFEESHIHSEPGETILHLAPGDAHDFEAIINEHWALPLLAQRLEVQPGGDA